MAKVRYGICGGLSAAQIEKINEKVLETLESVGMEVSNDKIRSFLNNLPGFNVTGSNVRFSKGLITECMEKQRAAAKKRPKVSVDEKPWLLHILNGYPKFLADYKTQTITEFLEKDVIKYTKLVDVLHERGVRGSTPGAPQDVNPLIRDIRIYQIGAKYSRSGGTTGNVPGPEVAEWMFRLFELFGQPKGLGVFVVNPLKAEGDTFNTLYEFRKDITAIMVGSMPQMGVTAPVSILGAYVIALAAAWGAYAIANALTGIEDMGFFCRPWPTYMKTMDITYGTPEMALGELINRQLAEFYGWPDDDTYAFHSSAPMADMQAGYQRGAYGMMAALRGDRSYRFGGLLGVDFVFSPEMLLLDLEAMEYFKHVADGIEFSDEMFFMDAIKEVGPAGSFIEHDSTLFNYSEHIWDPRLFVHESAITWAAKGSKTAADRAHELIPELIAKHDYHLPEDVERELDRICAEAEKALLG